MQSLPLPTSAAEDEAVIRKLAQDDAWKAHEVLWIEAYQAYRACGGNPFEIGPRDFGGDIADQQYRLYDNRRSSGDLARMRKQKGLRSCPVCGSSETGGLDHYLPRTDYPEFSIMRANLVPACGHCNSGAKGATIHGANPRRFIHPYFDPWAAEPLWFAEVVRPLEAATFVARPLATLGEPRLQIVEFHLQNVLGWQFERFAENLWATLPVELRMRSKAFDPAAIAETLQSEYAIALCVNGANSWHCAAFRGILGDDGAIEYLSEKAAETELPPGA